MVDDHVISEHDAAAGESGDGRDGESASAAGGGRRRWWTRRVFQLAALLVALVTVYVGVTFVQVWNASHGDDAQAAQAIVVLGAAQYDGRPSPVLEARLTHALALYREGLAPTLVVTGGRQIGDRFTEATASYNWLRANGVPDSAILKEVQGRTTWESLAAVSRFLRPKGLYDVVLVSDASHALRLRGVASEVGLEAHVSPERSVPRTRRTEFRALARETVAVSIGRLVGYRRLTRLLG